MMNKLFKIMMLVSLMCFAFSAVCSAKIDKATDSFDGSSIIRSEFKTVLIDPNYKSPSKDETMAVLDRYYQSWTHVAFNKVINKKETLYLVDLYLSRPSWYFFNEDKVQIKIDDEEKIYDFVVAGVKKNVSMGSCQTNCYIAILPEQVELVRNAKTMTMRVNFTNMPPITWIVPQNVLDEWKQVIDAN